MEVGSYFGASATTAFLYVCMHAVSDAWVETKHVPGSASMQASMQSKHMWRRGLQTWQVYVNALSLHLSLMYHTHTNSSSLR